MNKITNPFLIYGYAGPDYFCDRKEDTQKLISALRNGRNITLMSPRRMGKTGLIKNAFYQIHQENPEAACFYMDIFSTTCLNDFIILFGQTVDIGFRGDCVWLRPHCPAAIGLWRSRSRSRNDSSQG